MIRARLCAALVAVPLLALIGCDSATRPNPVSGTVTYKGQPIAEGMIYFDPTEPAGNKPTAGPIRDGKYDISAREGPAAGRYRVRITAIDPQAKAASADKGVDEIGLTIGPEQKELLPARYNRQSELSADIPRGGKKDLDFNLN